MLACLTPNSGRLRVAYFSIEVAILTKAQSSNLIKSEKYS